MVGFSHEFSSFRRSWCRRQYLPFNDVLSEERLQLLLAEEGVRFRRNVFTPLVILWTFMGQTLKPDHSCREAVAHLIALLVGQGQRPCAAGTGAYCEARASACPSKYWLDWFARAAINCMLASRPAVEHRRPSCLCCRRHDGIDARQPP